MEPAGEVEVAGLVVEGEESHVDLARGAELGGRRPEHVARVVDLGQAAHVLRREVVGAETIQLLLVTRVWPPGGFETRNQLTHFPACEGQVIVEMLTLDEYDRKDIIAGCVKREGERTKSPRGWGPPSLPPCLQTAVPACLPSCQSHYARGSCLGLGT